MRKAKGVQVTGAYTYFYNDYVQTVYSSKCC